MQAPLLPPGISRVQVEQLRQQQQQQHCGMALQGSGQQYHPQLQMIPQRQQLPQQHLHTQQQQLQPLQSQQRSHAQPCHLQSPAQQPHHVQHHQAHHHALQQQYQQPQGPHQDQYQEQQHQQGQEEAPTATQLSALNSTSECAIPEHAVQYPYMLRPEDLPAAGCSRSTTSTAQQQQELPPTGSSNSWAPAGAPIPSTPAVLQPRVPHRQQLQQEPLLEQQHSQQHSQQQLAQEHQRQLEQKQPQLSQRQQQGNAEKFPSHTGLHEYAGQAMRQQPKQRGSGSPHDTSGESGAVIPELQIQQLPLEHQSGPDTLLPKSCGHTSEKMQQQQVPVLASEEQQQERGHDDAADGATVSTLSDSSEARVSVVPQSAKQQEKKTDVCKAPQKATARTARTSASQKISCFEILYQDALHRRTRQLRAELGRNHAARQGKGQTCTPQQWEQRWNLMIKRHQEKISFNEALKRKLEVSKREDEGRECTFKPVTWSLRKPLVQQKRRLLKLEALAEQQQVLKEALFVLQYEEKQMDEYIAMKLQEEVGRASAEEKTDEELKNVLDFYRDRKIEETNRHRSMKLDLLTQLTRLDQQYKRTAASGNLQDTEAAEAVGFDLSLSDKIREDIMEELDSVNSLRSGAKFRAIWEASLPVYGSCCSIEEMQSDSTSPDFTVAGCGAALPASGAVAAAAYGVGSRTSLALSRNRGACSDRYGLKTLYQRRNSSGSASGGFPTRSSAAGASFARNTFASSSPSCLSKSRRGSPYQGGAPREQQPLRVSQLAASQPVSPRSYARYAHDNAPRFGGRPSSLQPDYPQEQTLLVRQQETQQLLQQANSHFSQMEEDVLQQQQQAVMAQQMEEAQEQQQSENGQPSQYEMEEQTLGDLQQQKTHSLVGSNAPPYGMKFTATVPAAGTGVAAGGHLLPPASATGLSLRTLPATSDRTTVQQTGWQARQLVGIQGSPRFGPFSTEPQQQRCPSPHVSPVAAPAARMSQSQVQQKQLSRTAHMSPTPADRRNPLQLQQAGAGAQQQLAISPRVTAYYAEQPNRSAPLFTATAGAPHQLASNTQKPLTHLPQHQQHTGNAPYPPLENVQLQQHQHQLQQQQRLQLQQLQQQPLQLQHQGMLLSQLAQWQRSAAGTWTGSPQQNASPTGAAGVFSQSFAHPCHPAVIPSAFPAQVQPLQGLPAHATQQQQGGVLATGTGRSVAAGQSLRQQQRAGHQQQVGTAPQHAVQHQLTNASQAHVGRTPDVATARASQPSSAGADPLSAALANYYQMHSPRATQAFVPPQQGNQTHPVAASATAAQARSQASPSPSAAGPAGLPRAAERQFESWTASLLGWHGRAAAALQLQQQQQTLQKAFALPPSTAAPPRTSLVKGTSLVHMPPFPPATAGLVDFAAAAKLCQRGNMLFAAR